MRDLCYSQDLSLFVWLNHSPVLHKSSLLTCPEFPLLCWSSFHFQNQKSKVLYLGIPRKRTNKQTNKRTPRFNAGRICFCKPSHVLYSSTSWRASHSVRPMLPPCPLLYASTILATAHLIACLLACCVKMPVFYYLQSSRNESYLTTYLSIRLAKNFWSYLFHHVLCLRSRMLYWDDLELPRSPSLLKLKLWYFMCMLQQYIFCCSEADCFFLLADTVFSPKHFTGNEWEREMLLLSPPALLI